MHTHQLRNAHLSKTLLPVILTVFLFIIGCFFMLFSFRAHIIKEKKMKIKELVESAWAVLDEYNNQVIRGEKTLELAQERAILLTSKLRYGSRMEDYFWITDMSPKLIMHPFIKKAYGADLSDFKDPQGDFLFIAMRDIVKEKGAGYHRYHWQVKDHADGTVRKISYVKHFQPWGWVIGTGIYLDEVNAEIYAFSIKILASSFVIFLMIVALSVFIIRQEKEMDYKRIMAEKALKESEEMFKVLAEQSTDVIMRFNRNGEHIYANPVCREKFGTPSEDVLGKTHSEIASLYPEHGLTPELAQKLETTVQMVFKTNETMSIEFDFKNRSYNWVVTPEKLPGQESSSVMTSARDITESRRMSQTSKMEAIGTLAGGIAHDFNNLLAPIIMGAEIILSDLPEESHSITILKEIINAGERARELVKQILYFSRQNDEERESVSLTEIVKEVVKFIRASLPTTIKIVQHHKTTNDRIDANTVRIQQVIMNLCTNAAYSMGKKGGNIEIMTKNEQVFHLESSHKTDLDEGGYVVLIVKDTGAGIDAEILEKIYDPFFTTKPQGEGTGMGLSVVHGIVQSHDGRIFVESEPGKGTTFRIFFPCAQKEEQMVVKEEEKEIPLKGQEHILLVDDEPAIVRMVQTALTKMNYTVEGFTDVTEAFNRFREAPFRYDIVITDQTMPNMTGVEFAQKICSIKKDLPILLCSGYNENIEPEKIKRYGIRRLLLKPIAVKELGIHIKTVLGETV